MTSARWVAIAIGLGVAAPAAAQPAATCPPGTRAVPAHPPSSILAKWCARPDRRALGIWGIDEMCAHPPPGPSFGVTQLCERADHVRHGPFMDFYASGDVQQVGQYRGGKMEGVWVRWADGLPRRKAWEEEYRDGQPHGRLASWHDNGARFQEGAFRDGRKDGHWTTWFPDGNKSEESDYVADRPHGPWASFHPGGAPKDAGTYDHGARVGVWRTYHSNGARRSEGRYARGAPDGAWTVWWENGNMAAAGTYAGGKRVEPWTWWHPDGTKAAPTDCRYELASLDAVGRCVATFAADAKAAAPNLVPAPPGFRAATAAAVDLRCSCRGPAAGRLTWTPAEPRGLGQRIQIGTTISTELSPHASAADLAAAERQFQWRVLTRVAGGWVAGPLQPANAACYPCDLAGGAR